MSTANVIHPAECYAIADHDGRLIEDSGSGKLAIYYARDDANFALPVILRSFPKASVVPVTISKA